MKIFLGIVIIFFIVILFLITRNFVFLFCNKWFYEKIDKKLNKLLGLNNERNEDSIDIVFNEVLDLNSNDRILNNKLVKLEKFDLFEIKNYITKLEENKLNRLKYIFDYSRKETKYWKSNIKFFPDNYKNFIFKFLGLILSILPTVYVDKIKEMINSFFEVSISLPVMYIVLIYLYIVCFAAFMFNDISKFKTKIYKIKKIIMFIIDNKEVSISPEVKNSNNYSKIELKFYKNLFKYIYCYDFNSELVVDKTEKLRNIFCNLIKLELTFNSYFYNMYKLSNYCNSDNNFSVFKINLSKLTNFELFSMYLNIKLTEKYRFYEKYFKLSVLFFLITIIYSFLVSLSLKNNLLYCMAVIIISSLILVFILYLLDNKSLRSNMITILEQEIEEIFSERGIEYKNYLN